MTTRELEDCKVHVKFKLSALWIAVMLCYIYGDFFSLFVPGRIQNLMDGNSGAGETTPVKLLLFAIMMSLPPFMVFLSLTLKPQINKWLNIIMGSLFTLIMILVVAASIDVWMIFYIYLGMVEIVITIFIIGQAWRWPAKK